MTPAPESLALADALFDLIKAKADFDERPTLARPILHLATQAYADAVVAVVRKSGSCQAERRSGPYQIPEGVTALIRHQQAMAKLEEAIAGLRRTGTIPAEVEEAPSDYPNIARIK